MAEDGFRRPAFVLPGERHLRPVPPPDEVRPAFDPEKRLLRVGDFLRRGGEGDPPRYLIERHLGTGGFGQVYLARVAAGEIVFAEVATRLSRDAKVAIKVVDVNKAALYGVDRARVQREVSVLNHLSRGDGVVRVYESFDQTIEGIPVLLIVEEFVEGGTLSSRVGAMAVGPAREAFVLSMAAKVVDVLAFMHTPDTLGRVSVHRDIKPENIMLLPDDSVRLIDFGEARTLLPVDSVTVTPAKGSEMYRAPEVVAAACPLGEGLGHYNELCDVWSLGVTVYFALTKKFPYGTYPSVVEAYIAQYLGRPEDALRAWNLENFLTPDYMAYTASPAALALIRACLVLNVSDMKSRPMRASSPLLRRGVWLSLAPPAAVDDDDADLVPPAAVCPGQAPGHAAVAGSAFPL